MEDVVRTLNKLSCYAAQGKIYIPSSRIPLLWWNSTHYGIIKIILARTFREGNVLQSPLRSQRRNSVVQPNAKQRRIVASYQRPHESQFPRRRNHSHIPVRPTANMLIFLLCDHSFRLTLRHSFFITLSSLCGLSQISPPSGTGGRSSSARGSDPFG